MARQRRAKYEAAPIEAVVHTKDTRLNIPTVELADFAVKEEQAPYILRYPRDPSLGMPRTASGHLWEGG